jgi:DNA-binding NarL/FixJ family response regulator
LRRAVTFEECRVFLEQETDVSFCFVYLGPEAFTAQVEQLVALKATFPNTLMVAFPNQRSQSAAMRLLSNGVEGNCAPFIGARQLGLALAVIESGEIWGGKDFIQGLIDRNPVEQDAHKQATIGLSERELEVATLVSKGLSNKQIADQLSVTERTVKAHLTSSFKKLKVKDRLGLALALR